MSEKRNSRKFLKEGIPESQLYLIDNLRALGVMMVLGFYQETVKIDNLLSKTLFLNFLGALHPTLPFDDEWEDCAEQLGRILEYSTQQVYKADTKAT